MAETTERKRRPRPPDDAPPKPKRPPRPRDAVAFRAFQVRATVMASLLAGRKLNEAAEVAGTSRPVVLQLLADPEFRAELEEARADLLRAVVDKTGSEALKSLETLAEIRDDKAAPVPSRVRASVEILRLAFGTPHVEIHTGGSGGSQGGTDPAVALRAFLGKLRDRDDVLEQARRAAAIDVESTEQ